jgi:excisionase family DNA binding protein
VNCCKDTLNREKNGHGTKELIDKQGMERGPAGQSLQGLFIMAERRLNMKKSERLTITVEEAGKLLGVSRPTIYKIASNRINGFPSFYIGKKILVHKDKFMEWLDNQVNVEEAINQEYSV